MKILIYQVLVRLYGNINPNPVQNGNIEENGCGKFNYFTDSCLQKIRNEGFNYIWYTGVIEHATQTDYSKYGIKNSHPTIVKGKAGSPYAIRDYYDVSPDLAENVYRRMEEFETLVQRTHQADLRVIIDFVPNHVARQYFSDAKIKEYPDFGKYDALAYSFHPHNNFYYLLDQPFGPQFSLYDDQGNFYGEFPAKVTGNDCFSSTPSCNDWYDTIKLNYGIDYLNGRTKHFDTVPSTWHKMLSVLLFWARKSIDGFRCDMVEMIPVEFWAWVIPKIKKDFPHIIFIAEIYNPGNYNDYLCQGHFDYLYDKVGMYDVLRGIITEGKPTKNITNAWQALGGIQTNMLNFLENHDEQRIASDFFAGDARKGRPASVVAATLNTNPFMIYFGQELGEKGMDSEGFSRIDGRTTIFDYWSLSVFRRKPSEEQERLRRYYTKVLQLCNKNKAINNGKFFDLMYVNNHLTRQYAYLRCNQDELLLIVVNFDGEKVETDVFIPSHAMDYFGIVGTIYGSKELLTNEIRSLDLQRDKPYHVCIKGYDAEIISFSLI
ncbi:MAG: alpha-amylase family glycosyl hydrolase [Candidatus Azobacteroides pseudotrichonymphae]|jgi:glycosidase|nr:MAG: alpha-amylase family glycosyl hydrolase [Candidatus Azobacteroides pseudotrichonymphae]